jgi:predicted O-methyltransferase YrrM
MEHFYQNIEGWFTYPELYKKMANHFPDGSRFVEIGVWKGASAAYMAVELINANKKIEFDCIDNWNGSVECPEQNLSNDPDWLFNHFLQNMEPVKEIINTIRKNSLDACDSYEDDSLDFVFIDAEHFYESVFADISAWYPKVKNSTGIIAGHDYSWSDDVKRAVHEFFDPLNLQIQEQEGCWIVNKTF